MPSCAIKWCGKCNTTSSYAKDGITFHRFPTDGVMKEAWINATQREDFFPSKTSVICSRHFTPDCFENLKNRRRLYSSSIPTLYWVLQNNQES
ncbi:THAP domain-containing protein [Phthorimaea operculella]|nr:THAP domain-containing protein [Phthorimaea operculella]